MQATPEGGGVAPEIVFDTTILSNFARIGQCQWLERMYVDRAWTTLMVVEEIQHGIEVGYSELTDVQRALAPTGWLAVTAPENGEEQCIYVRQLAALGSGEASCLAVARVRDMVLATDDRAARLHAAVDKVRLTGTLGILLRLVRTAQVPLERANRLLAEMRQRGYHSPVEILDSLV